MLSTTLLTTLALAATTLTAPTSRRGEGNTMTASSILALAPRTSSCASAPFPSECRTAGQAASYVAISFTNFGLASFGEQAAVLSLMLYESGDFQYDRNHYPAPGRPGQGTRNMQMPDYNLKYATYLATMCQNCGISEKQVGKARAKGEDAVLALVNTDQWSFGSAAWFLATQCDASVREGLKAGTQQGWEMYLTSCVGTTATEDRTAIWRKAMDMGHW